MTERTKLAVILALTLVDVGAIAGLAWRADRLNSGSDLAIALPLVIFVGLIVLVVTVALVIGSLSLLGVRRPGIQVGLIWQFGWLVVLAGAFSVATVATVVLAANTLKEQNLFRPEIILPLLLLTGLIALVIALAILVGAFHLFKLTTPTSPFGVPEGTLQAVIALTIILIFAVSSLYLRGSLDPQVFTVENLTSDQVEQISGAEIIAVRDAEGALFDVDRRVLADEDAKDFSNQLLTILGTLVGAIAGFYFGAKSVETGISVGGGGGVQPTNTSPPTIGGRPQVGEALRADPGGWTGSPPPTYSYRWEHRAQDEGEWLNIRDATEASYVVVSDHASHLLRVMVTATNSAGSASAPSPPTDPVAQAPINVRVPTVSGEPLEGKTLQAHHGEWSAWPELAPTSYSYQWDRADPTTGNWTPIPAASQPGYQLTRDDVGTRLRVRVTATNSVGSAEAISEQTDPIAGVPRVKPENPPTISGEPAEGNTLTAHPGEWSGWPALGPTSFSYQWERADPVTRLWTPIADAKGSEYQLTADDVGKRIRVRVKANNTMGSDEAVSNEIEVPGVSAPDIPPPVKPT